ncbi:MAG: M73 family metallopeptidase [Clostridiales bacterium]|jgi:hypothetical protein|nr:M73 family metallopeptidase [Clostridiales bacterium]
MVTNNCATPTNGKKRENKKYVVGLLCLAISFSLIIGTLAAYFSDIIIGKGTATAGTLDLSGSYALYVNGDTNAVSSVENFNPGDVIVVKATITNAGNKSAWVRDIIDISGSDGDILPFINVYIGEKTQAGLEIDDTTDLLNLNAGVYATAAMVIDGSGSNAEKETARESIGDYTYDVVFTVYFLPTATNDAQDKALDIYVATQALQYRNNQIVPNDAAWSTVVKTGFGK